MNWFRKVNRAIQYEIREHRSSFVVYTILRVIVIGLLIFELYHQNYQGVFLCILTLGLLNMPSFLQVTLKVELPTVLEIIILLFIFAAEILGEIGEFYIRFPFWDTILHTLNGFLAAAVGVSLVDLLNKSDRLVFRLSPLFSAIVGFCFSMTIGAIWEIFEFAMDRIFLLDMQKDTILQQISTVMLDPKGGNTPVVVSGIENMILQGADLGLGGYLDIGLYDTMYDLIVNFIGAVIFAVISYFYLKHQGKHGVIGKLIPKRKSEEKDFLQKVAGDGK